MINVSLISLIATIVISLIIAGVALLGFFHGLKRSIIGLCRTLAAVLLAFLAVFIFRLIIPAENAYSALLEPAVGKIDFLSDSAALREMGGAVIYTLLMPFVFSILFVIFDLLLLIPAHFIARSLGAGKDSAGTYSGADLGRRFGGAGIKLVTALMVTVVVMLPIAGIICTAADGVIKITETAKAENVRIPLGKNELKISGYTVTDPEGVLDTDACDRMVRDLIVPVRKNIYISLSYCAPVRAFCGWMTGASSGGNELAGVFDVASNALLFAVEPDRYGEKQKAAADNIINYISDSELHRNAVADAVSVYARNATESGKLPFGSGNAEMITSPLFKILANTTPESVKEDFETLGRIIGIMIDYDLPAAVAHALESKSEKELITSFANEEFLYELFSSLYSNDDYRHMIAPVLDYAFTVIVHNFDSEAERIYVATVSENYTDETIRNEAKVFARVFEEAIPVMDIAPAIIGTNNPTSAIVSSDISVLGRFVDHARESDLIGEGVTAVFLTILKTDTFNSMRSVADIIIERVEKDDNVNLENLLGSVKQFVGIMSMYEKGGSSDTAALASSLKDLNASCDEASSEVIKEIINDGNVLKSSVTTGSSEKKNDSSVTVLNVMLDELSTGEFSDEEYDKEAKAVDYTMKLVGADSKDKIKEVCGEKEERRDMIETISDSKIASSALVEIAYEDGDPSKPLSEDALELRSTLDEQDVENMRTDCKEFYQEKVAAGEANDQLAINIKALSSVFDCNISDEDLQNWAAEAKKD